MVDVNAVPALWEELRKDQANWVLFTYGDNNTIVEAGKGNGGFAEFKSHLKEDGIFYGGFRVMAVDEENSKRSKFIFVTWVGEKVSPLKRARVSTHKPLVREKCVGAHIELQAASEDDLTEEVVTKKLASSGGAHQPTGYEF
eukprot:TRINITY_DN128_c0_g1_i1.p1 TRINITY_DN128_c0_g1~~TRINITY_DN128_c0_g1_i1.p1  ORF type:complete len:142 (+),score=41.13 TRINITY_DN128_c0_g1_i1:277-702(+)